ncbi:MAG: hypothetical protein RLY43_1679 [Bacteroidota bacterium]
MKKRKFYYDNATVRNLKDSSNWEVTPNGFLIVPVTITRTGIFLYFDNGRFDRRLRAEADVLDQESLRTLKGLPVTNEHPEDDIDLENVKKYLVGNVIDEIEIRTEDNITYLDTYISIFDKDTQDLVLSGQKTEFSCGYSAVIISESGIWNGEEYDSRQTQIRYNHGSIVEKGRAGRKVKIRMSDSDDIEELDVLVQCKKNKNENKKGEKRTTMLINGVKIEVKDSEEALILNEFKLKDNAIATVKNEKDSLEARLLVAEKEAKELKSQVDSLKNYDKKEEAKKLLAIQKKGSYFLQKDVSDMDEKDIIKESVKANFKDTDFTGKDENFFNVAFQLLPMKKESLRDSFSISGGNAQDNTPKSHHDSLLERYKVAIQGNKGDK